MRCPFPNKMLDERRVTTRMRQPMPQGYILCLPPRLCLTEADTTVSVMAEATAPLVAGFA